MFLNPQRIQCAPCSSCRSGDGFLGKTPRGARLAMCVLVHQRFFCDAANTCPAHDYTCSGSGNFTEVNETKVVDAGVEYPTGEASFKVFQPFPNALSAEMADPFLMCDEWGESRKTLGETAIDEGPPHSVGTPHVGWHPHRGFDILSYIKEGRGRHADSLGNLGIVRPGGLQWMRTGSGVEHAEGGGNPEGARKHGFQIWINLPGTLKMSDPDYGTVQPEDIPEVLAESGALTRSLAGAGGASFQSREDVHIADCELPPSVLHRHVFPRGVDRIILYIYRGHGVVAGRMVGSQQGVVLDASSCTELSESQCFVVLRSQELGLGVMVFAGRQLKEPIAWQGPIVMNTDHEIRSAFSELRRGMFYRKKVSYDYHAAADKTV